MLFKDLSHQSNQWISDKSTLIQINPGEQMMEGSQMQNVKQRIRSFVWRSDISQSQAKDKRMKVALVLKILSVFVLASLGRGTILVDSILMPTSTVLFLGMMPTTMVLFLGMMTSPAFGIVLSNNNQRGGSFSSRVKSNLPSLNVSFYLSSLFSMPPLTWCLSIKFDCLISYSDE